MDLKDYATWLEEQDDFAYAEADNYIEENKRMATTDYDNIVVSWLDNKDGRTFFVTPEVGIDYDENTIDTRMCGCEEFETIEEALEYIKQQIGL